MRALRWIIGLALLAFQIGAISYARFVPERYFCWAPFDMQTDYRLQVTVNGRRLSDDEIQRRYRRPSHGTDNRSSHHIMDIVAQAERRYHARECTEVIMTYRVNGKQEQRWQYRQP